MNNKKQNSLVFLDGLRGIAAFYVMVGHARWILHEGYSGFIANHENYNFFNKLLFYFFSFFRYGHEAVMFFFVLSGFVIHLRYSRQLSNNRFEKFDFKDFFVRRFRRIFPPLFIVLIITLLLDTLGQNLGYSIYFNNTPNELLNRNIGVDLSLELFLKNIFFLQGLVFSTFGSNGPLWSISYEWWFYMLYPLVFFINKKNVFLSLVVAVLFAILGRYYHVEFISNLLACFVCWWLGGIAVDIYNERIKINTFILYVLLLFIPIGLIGKQHLFFYSDYFISVGFFAFIVLTTTKQDINKKMLWLKKIKWLGDSSYTLYIIHFPILVFINGIVLSKNGNRMPETFVFVVGSILFSLLIAYLLHFIIEKPFVKKRKI